MHRAAALKTERQGGGNSRPLIHHLSAGGLGWSLPEEARATSTFDRAKERALKSLSQLPPL